MLQIYNLPYNNSFIQVGLNGARKISLSSNSIVFILTLPPYINVINYHQQYRSTVEQLGCNVLKVAKTEIGSNWKNRSNRFLTVIQYCLDMDQAIKEMHKVLN